MIPQGKIYRLVTPKDEHGQPIRLFKAREENNVAKAIDQLTGICTGILADGIVSPKEAEFFAEWVQKFTPLEPVWPFTDILKRVKTVFTDGRASAEECEELRGVMEALCGYTVQTHPIEAYSTSLPLDNPPPDPVIIKSGYSTSRANLHSALAKRLSKLSKVQVAKLWTLRQLASPTISSSDCLRVEIGRTPTTDARLSARWSCGNPVRES